MHGETLKD